MTVEKQHVNIYQKLLLRKRLLPFANPDGAAYVPFIGDGDIAVELYQDRDIYGADIDEGRVVTARSRLPNSNIIQADCDTYPFPHISAPFSVADLDAYSYPYDAFNTWLQQADILTPCAIFFTDGQRQGIKRSGAWRNPSGERIEESDLIIRRKVYNFYWTKEIQPWLKTALEGYTVVRTMKYLRRDMIYYGVVLHDN